MIVNAANWNTLQPTTGKEASQPKAALRFNAKTTLHEKITRLVNASIFLGYFAHKLSARWPLNSISTYLPLLNSIGNEIHTHVHLKNPVLNKIAHVASTVAFLYICRKVLAVVISHIAYPATLRSYSDRFDGRRELAFKNLSELGFLARRLTINKSGIDYDAFAIQAKKDHPWVIIADGNTGIGEESIEALTNAFNQMEFNILYVNGPAVGRSSGFPTSYSIAAGQEAGLQFLEEVVQTKKILLYGYSMGGGAQAEAILSHAFKKDVEYMVWSDRTFDLLSNAASAIVTRLAKPLFFILGIELNGIAAAKRLEKFKIKHIVAQNFFSRENLQQGTDHIIPNSVSLAYGISKAGLCTGDRLNLFGNNRVWHNEDLPTMVMNQIRAELKKL